MQVKTLLNFVEKHKGFIYDSVSWGRYEGKPGIEENSGYVITLARRFHGSMRRARSIR